MDKIHIKDLEIIGFHGAIPEEKVLGQKFVLSFELDVDLRQAGKNDDLTKTVHYGELAQKVEEDYEKTRAQIQWQLIKEKVARNYDIKVEEEDMLRLARFYAAQQFAQYGMSNLPEDVIEKYAQELLKKDDVKSDIQNRAFEDKVYAAIQDAVGIDEKTVSVEDFNKLFEAAK